MCKKLKSAKKFYKYICKNLPEYKILFTFAYSKDLEKIIKNGL